MPETNYRALCAELVDELEDWIYCDDESEIADTHLLINRARAALTQHEPAGATDEELIEIAHELRKTAEYLQLGCGWARAVRAIESAANLIEGDILQRLAPPAVPVARPEDEYHEDMGAVLWWRFPIDEPPYCGSPLDSEWPGYHTHFTPLGPMPTPEATNA